jgi:glutaminyl-peptide cyclotransferase
MRRRPLLIAIAVPVVVIAVLGVLLAAGAFSDEEHPGTGTARANLFDGPAAWRILKMQVRLGPRPAGSTPSRRLAERLRRMLPNGRFQPVPGGLRNVVGTVPGRDPGRYVVVGAHYDTKEIPGFVGANDGAGGTAAVVQLARQLKPRTIGPTVQFVLFDGEESPGPSEDIDFEDKGLRGSKVAAKEFKDAEAMILLDFVADRKLSIPHEGSSDPPLWAKLRQAAERAGVASYFPDKEGQEIIDDQTPFLDGQGIPSIDVIDFDFPCWHKSCDNLSAVSERSLDASGEAVAGLLRTLR